MGKWVTIAGRRIFIKDGEDLAEAMKNSGKFKVKEASKQSIENKYSKQELEDINKTINIYKKAELKEKDVDNLIEDFKTAINLFDKQKSISEEELDVIFSDIYNIGKWQEKEDVYFPKSLAKYLFIGNHPHIANGELGISDIEELKGILDYTDYANSKDSKEVNFFTKSKSRDGYYECVMETTKDNYRIFHYQYMKEKNVKKKLKKLKNK